MNDFREQCRRQLERSLKEIIKYGFFKQCKSVLDDAENRFFFDKMEDNRKQAD